MSEALWWIRCAFFLSYCNAITIMPASAQFRCCMLRSTLHNPICRQHVCHDAKIPPAMHGVQGAQHDAILFTGHDDLADSAGGQQPDQKRCIFPGSDRARRLCGHRQRAAAQLPKGPVQGKPGGASIMLMAIATCLQSSASARMRIPSIQFALKAGCACQQAKRSCVHSQKQPSRDAACPLQVRMYSAKPKAQEQT